PCDPPGRGGTDRPGWRPVRKRIRRFALTGGHGGAGVPGQSAEAGGPGALAPAATRGQAALAPAGLGKRPAPAVGTHPPGPPAALALAQSVPGGVELGTGDSQPRVEWLTGSWAPGDAHA